MSFQSLTASSTPEQIAAAYRDYSNIAGNNVAVQGAARTMLLNKGVAAPAIDQAFSLFANPVELKAAPPPPPVVQKPVAPVVVQSAPVVQKPVVPVAVTAPKPVAVSAPIAPVVQKPAVAASAPTTATAPVAGGVSDAFILSWLANNPNPTAAQISALSQFGVTADRVKALSGAGATPAPVTTPAAPKAVTPTAENPFPGMTVEDLYRVHAGKEPDAEGLAFWKSAFGPEISEAERAQFIQSVVDVQNQAAAKPPAVTSAATPAEPAATTNPGSIEALYQEILGRTPNAEEVANWQNQFGNEVSPEERAVFQQAAAPELSEKRKTWDQAYPVYAEMLESGKATKESVQNLYGPLNQDFANRINSIYDEITAQQQAGTEKYFVTGRLPSKDAVAMDMAYRLAERGVSSLQDVGVRKVEKLVHDEGSERIVVEDEYFNKSTGEPIKNW